jgi:hypothetical protein
MDWPKLFFLLEKVKFYVPTVMLLQYSDVSTEHPFPIIFYLIAFVDLLLDLFFGREDGSDMFFRNVNLSSNFAEI